jgi:hypothetical protein
MLQIFLAGKLWIQSCDRFVGHVAGDAACAIVLNPVISVPHFGLQIVEYDKVRGCQAKKTPLSYTRIGND